MEASGIKINNNFAPKTFTPASIISSFSASSTTLLKVITLISFCQQLPFLQWLLKQIVLLKGSFKDNFRVKWRFYITFHLNFSCTRGFNSQVFVFRAITESIEIFKCSSVKLCCFN